jgi:vacuolar iron transporter family protein
MAARPRKRKSHTEQHHTDRVGWLRAAVLGANDGLLSTSSLILGVAAAKGQHGSVLIAGTAGLVAGAMSMAAGEYVSVSSQADTEGADLAREAEELKDDPAGEQQELAGIYVSRGLDPELANKVAAQFMKHNALEAHARDELGITEQLTAKPVQAALASAASFSIGAGIPLLVCAMTSGTTLVWSVAIASLFCLLGLGALAAHTGGSSVTKGALRVSAWGCLAMGATLLIGHLCDTVAGL